MINDDDKVSINDQVCFVFEDVLKRVFCKYKLSGVSKGKMLLDFLGTKNQENFLNLLLEGRGSSNHVFWINASLKS